MMWAGPLRRLVTVAAVALLPGAFGLPPSLSTGPSASGEPPHRVGTHGLVALGIACACVVFIWLVGLTASALRLWRTPTGPSAGNTVSFKGAILGTLGVAFLVIPTASVWAAEQRRRRDTWLSGTGDAYNALHRGALLDDLTRLASDWPDEVRPSLWWWSTFALFAVMRSRTQAPARPRRPLAGRNASPYECCSSWRWPRSSVPTRVCRCRCCPCS